MNRFPQILPVRRCACSLLLASLFLLILESCSSYYRQNEEFHRFVANGDIRKAAEVLAGNQKAAEGKSRLLYFMEQGVIQQMLGNYQESNNYLEQAYIFTEDERGSLIEGAISLLTNPMNTTYTGEDFERVQIHYYKALNFLQLNRLEEALVECRRINIKLNEMNDRYEFRKNRYKSDAFAYNLMGIIFEASGEYNDAFTSYRNAYEAYREVYGEFGLQAPQQLKQDLMRSAWQNGFSEELRRYEAEFGLSFEPSSSGGEIILFWNNGLGPVKDEWSINFAIHGGEDGRFYFQNDELGLSFPFHLDDEEKRKGLTDLKLIRIAFPKYVERIPVYQSAEVLAYGRSWPVETAQDINEIAFATLRDRMVREMATSLLRFGLKQLTEHTARKQNKGLGFLVNLTNAFTERADTRNWQTLPHSIGYTRLALPAGEHQLELRTHGQNGRSDHTPLRFQVEDGKTRFYIHNSLESLPLAPRVYGF